MALIYIDLQTTDPAFNLAAEEYVFDILPRDHDYCMLWQNDNAIIIGKHQNTLAEINSAFVEQHGIRLVRRLSGGGAVYHDMGNLNFTFISNAGNTEQLDFRLFCQPVVQVLETLGVHAEVSGRNDMTIDGKKFSGNSQYIRNGRVMHHGTILFDSDLSVVSRALQVDPSKIQSKGIASVRSRVTNVRPYLPKDTSLPEFRQLLLQEIAQQQDSIPYTFTAEDIRAIEQRKEQRYNCWDWNYGASPACTLMKKQRFDNCGSIEAYLNVERGLIQSVTFRGDFFSVREPDELAQHLVGFPPERSALRDALANINTRHYFAGLDILEFLDFLCE